MSSPGLSIGPHCTHCTRHSGCLSTVLRDSPYRLRILLLHTAQVGSSHRLCLDQNPNQPCLLHNRCSSSTQRRCICRCRNSCTQSRSSDRGQLSLPRTRRTMSLRRRRTFPQRNRYTPSRHCRHGQSSPRHSQGIRLTGPLCVSRLGTSRADGMCRPQLFRTLPAYSAKPLGTPPSQRRRKCRSRHKMLRLGRKE